jgi:uncharacterized protein
MKVALKAGEKDKLRALRMILAGVRQFEVDNREELDDTASLDLLTKMAKQRRESISQFDAAGRDDLSAKERFELDLITGYLPQQLSEAEIDTHIETAIANASAAGMRDMGRVMSHLKDELKGRADMATVSTKVKSRLSA